MKIVLETTWTTWNGIVDMRIFCSSVNVLYAYASIICHSRRVSIQFFFSIHFACYGFCFVFCFLFLLIWNVFVSDDAHLYAIFI